MKVNIRKLLIGLVIIVVLAFIVFRGDQLVNLIETMKTGAIIPLIAAICTQLGKYVAQSFAYSFSFLAVEEKMKPRDTLPLVFGTFFMNTIAPSLNMAGATLVIDDARKRGISAGKATSAALFMQMTIESGFMTIMIIGFVILQFAGNLNVVWFLLGLLVVAMVAFMGGIMVVGRKNPQALISFLRPIEQLVNRIRKRFKREPLKPWVERIVVSFGEAAGLIVRNPKVALKSFSCSVIASTCELACFCLVGIAFNIDNPQALVTGYVVATLFAMVAITPQGVGVVETAVPILFATHGVEAAAGVAIALVYRGLVFWMPFLIGAVLIQRTKTFYGKNSPKKSHFRVKGRKADDAKKLEEDENGMDASLLRDKDNPLRRDKDNDSSHVRRR